MCVCASLRVLQDLNWQQIVHEYTLPLDMSPHAKGCTIAIVQWTLASQYFFPLCPFLSPRWFAAFAPYQNFWYKRLLARSEVFLSAFCEFFSSLLCVLGDHCNPCICSGSWANLNSPSGSLHCDLLPLEL